MIDLSQAAILEWFAQFADNPGVVYWFIVSLLLMSSFGLPVPEEVVLISAGLVSYIAMNPELYNHLQGTALVNPWVTAGISFGAVILSDILVFYIGRKFGKRALQIPVVQKVFTTKVEKQVISWTEKHGKWAAGIFRFTPGLRFPGHLMCGVLGVTPRQFIFVDGTAALISVPTQVLLIAFYGDVILAQLKQVKISLLVVIVSLLIIFALKKYFRAVK